MKWMMVFCLFSFILATKKKSCPQICDSQICFINMSRHRILVADILASVSKSPPVNLDNSSLCNLTGIKPSVLSETINGKRGVSVNMAAALEKTLGIPADIWLNLQAQFDLDTAHIAERSNEKETVSVTIPVRDHNLLKELVRKFGWVCAF